MLIGLFKSNQKLINVLVVVLTILLWLPSFWGTPAIHTHTPDGSLFAIIEDVNGYKFFSFLIAVLLISGQAIYLNRMVNEFKWVTNNTHLTALLFVFLNGVNASMLVLNPMVIANSFVLLAFHQLVKMYNTKNSYSLSFNTGLLLAIATLIYNPLVVLFPLIWLVLIYTKTPSWRDFIISLLGFFVPLLFYVTYYFLNNSVSSLLAISNSQSVFETGAFPSSYFGRSIFYGLVGVGILVGLSLVKSLNLEVVKIRKHLVIVILLFLLLLCTLIFNAKDYFATYLLLSVPFSIVLARFFNTLKRNWLSEIIFLILLIAVSLGYFS